MRVRQFSIILSPRAWRPGSSLAEKKDFAAGELFGEIGVPGKDQDLMKTPSESELCILWDKNNLGSYQLQRLSCAASSFTERDFKSLDLEIKFTGTVPLALV